MTQNVTAHLGHARSHRIVDLTLLCAHCMALLDRLTRLNCALPVDEALPDELGQHHGREGIIVQYQNDRARAGRRRHLRP